MINAIPVNGEASTQPTHNKPGPFRVKAYSTGELSKMYEVTNRTFGKWLEPFHDKIGEKIGRYYNVVQVEIIINQLGLPHWVE